MINSVTLSGRLTKDVEYKVTTNGTKVATFTLAVQRSYKDSDGNYLADFPRIIAFRGAADIANNYLNKGDLCNVHGRLQTRQFDNDNGQRVFLTEIISDDIQLISTGNNNNQQSYSQNANNVPQQQGYNNQQNYNQKPQQNYNQKPQQSQQQRGQAQPNYNQGQQQNGQPQQQNPFGNANGPIDIEDDDLPF